VLAAFLAAASFVGVISTLRRAGDYG
jgi:hypothetical protein